MSDKVAKIVIQEIMDKLENGTVPWHKPWKVSEETIMSYHGRSYRGINLFLTALSGRSGPWITYNQLKKQGGRVKDGEYKKSMPIVLWKWLKKENKTTGKTETFPIMRFYKVWSLDQCENVPKPKWLEKQDFDPIEVNPIEEAEKIWENFENKPTLEQGSSRACYFKVTDKIELPKTESFESMPEYYSTLFHEAAHSTGHSDRLDRFSKSTALLPFGSEDYSKEELVAEFTSAILMAESGIKCERTLDNSAAYIAGWRKKLSKEPKILIVAAQQAQKAADHILGRKPQKYEEKS